MTFVHNLLHLAISQQLFYVVLVVTVLVTARASRSAVLNRAWRFMYLYTSVVCGLYLAYATLRLSEVLGPKDFIMAVRWLGVFLAVCLVWPALLHTTESKHLRPTIDKLTGRQSDG